MASVPLAPDEAERMLAGLDAAHDQLAAAMYALDSHPALVLLRGNTVAGGTKRRADGLTGRLTVLWAHFSAAGDLLEAAQAVRARRGKPNAEDLAELTALLREPMIPLDADGLPADGTGKPVAKRLSLAQLLPKLSKDANGLLAELSEVDTAVSALTGRIVSSSEKVARLAERAASLGDDGLAGQAKALGDRVDVAGAEALADPLTSAPGGSPTPAVLDRLAALDAEADRLAAALSDVEALRTGYAQRRDRLTALLSTLEDTEAAVAPAYATVAEKIAHPGLPAAPAAAAGLRARLDELDALHDRGAWVALGAAFTAAERDTRRATERAEALRTAADGLLARRDELRGRLDAYRAKAARRGRLEEPALTERYRAAHDLLYTAPCDLPAATRAVFAYQQALAEQGGHG